jgi:hypothetical protein
MTSPFPARCSAASFVRPMTEHHMTDSYEDRVRSLRKAKKLHPEVERRLVKLLRMAFPESPAAPEVSAVPGGRNDLLQYFYDGRRIVLEVFCSASQVPQDLRLLEQCDAAVRIAGSRERVPPQLRGVHRAYCSEGKCRKETSETSTKISRKRGLTPVCS